LLQLIELAWDRVLVTGDFNVILSDEEKEAASKECLDKCLISNTLRQEFPNASVLHLEYLSSDHMPLLLTSETEYAPKKRKFRFQK
ncbi:hypothetical protein PIB30_094554, partial [Stylosanthes scabra]|nr:hypothetical protein [Stylosanthes scabra]